MKKLVLLACLFTAVAVQAQKEKVVAYINTYRDLAMDEMVRTGIPASITLAQGILESQSGESELVKSSNNHFGIKCKTEWTGPRVYHDDDEKGECFRVYATPQDSYRDHSDFLRNRPNYAFLFKLDPTDYEGWAYGLKKAGYATSPVYPQKLLKLINEYHLQQYSLTALARMNNPQPANQPPAGTALAAVSTASTDAEPVTPASADKIQAEQSSMPAPVSGPVDAPAPAPVKKKASYPAGIFSINHTRVVYATEGTSMLSLANQYDIPLVKLIEFNELNEMDVLDTDRLIYIEKKPKKGAADFHLVAEGETLHDISQQEGIRLESLLEYNHFAKNAKPTAGEKILLKAASAPIAGNTAKSPK